MGGGVSSSIARALGAGRAGQARRLAAHAVVLAAAFGLAFTALDARRGPGDLSPPRRQGRAARRSPRVLEPAVRRRGDGVVRQHVREHPARDREHARAVGRALGRRGAARPARRRPRPRRRSVPAPRHRRSGDRLHRQLHVRRCGDARVAPASRQRPPAEAGGSAIRVDALRRHPARRRAVGGVLGADRAHRRRRHRHGRGIRRRGARRLRGRRPTRVAAGPAGVRPRTGDGRPGRHEHRRRSTRARQADRFRGRSDVGDDLPRDRADGRDRARRLGAALLGRPGGACRRRELLADRRAALSPLRGRHGALLRLAGCGPGAVAGPRGHGASWGRGDRRTCGRQPRRAARRALRVDRARAGDLRGIH